LDEGGKIMYFDKRHRRLVLLALSPVLGLLTGCGASHARFTPTSGEARSALEAALTAWRDGKPYGPVAGSPPVQVGDSAWQGGQQLEAFQIGDEEDAGDGTKQFAVALKMKKTGSDQSVRYIVHGRDPVWVYREEDYKRMLNMDNNPVQRSGSAGGARPTGRRR
jgi:hypothetical protein